MQPQQPTPQLSTPEPPPPAYQQPGAGYQAVYHSFSPVFGPPRPPRLWPDGDDNSAAPPWLLGAGVAAGVLAALTIRDLMIGAAYAVTGAVVLAIAFWSRRRRPTVEELAMAAVAVCLLTVGAFRSAEWLVVPCLLAGLGVGTLALLRARTWTGLAVGSVAGVLVPARAVGWARRADLGLGAAPQRLGPVLAITLLMLLVFGALFAAADPEYADLIARATPSLDLLGGFRAVSVLCVAFVGATGLFYVAHRPPLVDRLAPPPGRPVKRWEWAVPLIALDLLFLSFVLVQLPALFGGHQYVLQTRGLSLAGYARQGFWMLLIVTVLTIVVVAIAVRTAPRTTVAEQLLVRVLLGALCVLALVIVASALSRMSLYQAEYGFTRLRLAVKTVELALGAVFVLLLLAGLQLTAVWLPRAVLVLTCGSLLALAVVDPDAYIARESVERFERTGSIDNDYLSGLSPDAVPELIKLPARLQGCALERLAVDLMTTEDPWYDANLARSRARDLLSRRPLVTGCVVGR